MEHASRWADAGWPPGLVRNFFVSGQDEWVELGLEPDSLDAEALASQLPFATGGDWVRCGVSELALAYAFESQGWSPEDVAVVGAESAKLCITRGYSLDRLKEYAALRFKGRKAIRLINAGVDVDSLAGWDPAIVYSLLDWAGFTNAHRLNDLLAGSHRDRKGAGEDLSDIKAIDADESHEP